VQGHVDAGAHAGAGDQVVVVDETRVDVGDDGGIQLREAGSARPSGWWLAARPTTRRPRTPGCRCRPRSSAGPLPVVTDPVQVGLVAEHRPGARAARVDETSSAGRRRSSGARRAPGSWRRRRAHRRARGRRRPSRPRDVPASSGRAPPRDRRRPAPRPRRREQPMCADCVARAVRVGGGSHGVLLASWCWVCAGRRTRSGGLKPRCYGCRRPGQSARFRRDRWSSRRVRSTRAGRP
jgi:hypothetical protein